MNARTLAFVACLVSLASLLFAVFQKPQVVHAPTTLDTESVLERLALAAERLADASNRVAARPDFEPAAVPAAAQKPRAVVAT